MRKILKIAALTLGALILLAVAIPLARIVFYRQSDDRERVERKRAYLERVSGTTAGARPNLVLILFDDLGYGDVGAYGSTAIRTPHLDALAESGAMFRHAYAGSPYCSASRAALLTGRYPQHAELSGNAGSQPGAAE